MKFSGVKPAGTARKTGGWNESDRSFHQRTNRRPEKADAAFQAAEQTDTLSFSDLMLKDRQGGTGGGEPASDMEFRFYLGLASDSNERLRQMLGGLREHSPRTEASVYAAYARLRKLPFPGDE